CNRACREYGIDGVRDNPGDRWSSWRIPRVSLDAINARIGPTVEFERPVGDFMNAPAVTKQDQRGSRRRARRCSPRGGAVDSTAAARLPRQRPIERDMVRERAE